MLTGRHVNKYYLKYWYFFLIGVVALVLVDYFQLFIPEILGNIVDSINEGRKIDIGSLFLRLTLIGVGMCVGRITWRLTLITTSKKIEANIRREMFEKAERLSQKFYHENKVGSIMAWFTNDLETIEEYFGWGTIMLVDAFFMGILVIVKMVSLNLALSLLTAFPVVLIIIWGALVEKFMAQKWDERQKAFDSLYDFTQENLQVLE